MKEIEQCESKISQEELIERLKWQVNHLYRMLELHADESSLLAEAIDGLGYEEEIKNRIKEKHGRVPDSDNKLIDMLIEYKDKEIII